VRVPTHPDDVRRRIAPDEVQTQIILGSLLGDATLFGPAGKRRLSIVHSMTRLAYASWKHDQLGSLVSMPLRSDGDLVWFDTIAHPFFDDLGPLFDRAGGVARIRRERVLPRLAPLGLAVWLSDVGRAELDPSAFLPSQARLALSA
jgi:LAGLIDADG DNA endonuclease family protein